MAQGNTTIENVIEQIDDWKGKDVSHGRWPDMFMWNFNYEVTRIMEGGSWRVSTAVYLFGE